MAFKDLTLPDCYNLDVRVTRQVRSDDVTALSGDIYPNQKWAYSRRQFRCTWGPKKLADVEEFIRFWEVVKTTHTFRLRDEQDYRSADHGFAITNLDQPIGVGDGSTTAFWVVKSYSYGGETYVHRITTLVNGSLLLAVAGLPQTETTDYTFNHETGLIKFNAPPGNGQLITAGYEYDVKVRLEDASLTHRFRARHLGEIDTFNLIEDPR
jgi:uncharacterized protein (TIGR02217 family)